MAMRPGRIDGLGHVRNSRFFVRNRELPGINSWDAYAAGFERGQLCFNAAQSGGKSGTVR